MNRFLTLIFISLLFASCSTTKVLRYEQPNEDVVKTVSLRNFLQKNKTPKVVLRIDNNSGEVIPNETNDFIYNTIENELLANGFIVRDRELFNKIIENQDNNTDYEMLQAKSDTDLIIEITDINPSVPYETNTYYDKKDRKKQNTAYSFLRYGAEIEYKVVMIESNQFVGVYKFYFAPCSSDEGCVVTKEAEMKDKLRKKMSLRASSSETKAGEELAKEFKGMNKNDLKSFIQNSTERLVKQMRE